MAPYSNFFQEPLPNGPPVQTHGGPDFSESLPTILTPCRTQPILLRPVIRLHKEMHVTHHHMVIFFPGGPRSQHGFLLFNSTVTYR